MNHSESTRVQMRNKCVHNLFHPARTFNNLVVISIVFKGNCDTDISIFTILILDCFFNFPSVRILGLLTQLHVQSGVTTPSGPTSAPAGGSSEQIKHFVKHTSSAGGSGEPG